MSTTVKKPTKKALYATTQKVLAAAEEAGIVLEGEISYADLNEFLGHEVELLANKTASAQKRAEKKKLEGDELREKIYGVLTNDFALVSDIVAAVGDPDVSSAMAVSRLTQLVELHRAEKDQVTVPAAAEGGKAKKLSAYRLAQAE